MRHMNQKQIDPAARVGRFTGRFAFYDDPAILEQLGRAAADEGTSAASVVRSAVRHWLAEHDHDRRVG